MKARFHPHVLPWVCVLSLFAAQLSGAAIFSTIVTNGPATNRVNVVLFAEGYTSSQQAQFLVDATNAANVFLGTQPYAEYSNYFNVFAIFTNSANAGSTFLAYQTYTAGRTYFNSCYDNNYRIITIPPSSTFDTTYSHGQGKIDALLQTYLPATNNNLSVLLVNSPIAGGSDNYGQTAVTSVGGINDNLVHESGHVLGGLGDEYSDAYPGFPDVEEPNTTTNTVRSLIKWNAWIAAATPLPTPDSYGDATTVGLFQGAHYHATGWYRPCLNCRMASLSVDFCPVCQETLVLAVYGKIRPLEGRSPATNSLAVTSAQMLTFTLNLLPPATHALNVQWRTNNVAVAGATNPVFNLWPAQVGNGTNRVTAEIWDATPLVRTDAKSLLKQTNLWTLTVAVPSLQIDTPKWLTNGSCSFRVTGTAPAGVVIQVSTNLTQWTPAYTNAFTTGELLYTNVGARTNIARFYRALTPP